MDKFNRIKAILPGVFAALALLFAPVVSVAREPVAGCALDGAELRHAIQRSQDLMSIYLRAVETEMGASKQYGFAVAVSACGEMVWNQGYGFADLENAVPVSGDTKFRIGSVSKTLTAAALGRLVDAGRLDLDKEVQAYVPDFPVKQHPITVRQVAGHLAGIRHYDSDAEFLSDKPYATVRDALAIFADDPLVNEPGTAFFYSTYGWNLLSAVVEGAAGENFLDYMQDHVFKPAGMTATVADVNARIIARRTRFYDFDKESKTNANAPHVDLSNKWAGGGFLSTPTDLLRFADAVFNRALIEPDTLSLLTASQHDASGAATNYGIGWFTDMAPRELERAGEFFPEQNFARTRAIIGDDRIIGHTGGSVGGLTLFIAAPDSAGAVVVAATSNNGALFPAFALPIAAEFIDASKPD